MGISLVLSANLEGRESHFTSLPTVFGRVALLQARSPRVVIIGAGEQLPNTSLDSHTSQRPFLRDDLSATLNGFADYTVFRVLGGV